MFLHLFVCPQGGGVSYDVTSCYGQHSPLDSTSSTWAAPPLPLGQHHPLPVNKGAVRIILECFLVIEIYTLAMVSHLR